MCFQMVCSCLYAFFSCQWIRSIRERRKRKKTSRTKKSRPSKTTRSPKTSPNPRRTSELDMKKLLKDYKIKLPLNERIRNLEEFLLSKNYEILTEVIGEGSFGTVMKAKKFDGKGGHEMIAVKTMDVHQCKTSTLVNEIYTTTIVMENSQQLKQEHLIKIFDLFLIEHDLKKTAYIFMELSTDGDLESELWSVGQLDNKTAQKYFSHLVYAIDFLHYYRVAHRDIKLSNLLIFRDMTDPTEKIIKLTDFGLSRIQYSDSNKETEMERIGGTRTYKAPEIFRLELERNGYPKIKRTGEKVDPYSADIWAMGVCLFYMITNEYPFQIPAKANSSDDDLFAVYEKQMNRGYRFPKDTKYPINSLAKDLVERLLEPIEKKRQKINIVKSHKWLEGIITLSLTLTDHSGESNNY